MSEVWSHAKRKGAEIAGMCLHFLAPAKGGLPSCQRAEAKADKASLLRASPGGLSKKANSQTLAPQSTEHSIPRRKPKFCEGMGNRWHLPTLCFGPALYWQVVSVNLAA